MVKRSVSAIVSAPARPTVAATTVCPGRPWSRLTSLTCCFAEFELSTGTHAGLTPVGPGRLQSLLNRPTDGGTSVLRPATLRFALVGALAALVVAGCETKVGQPGTLPDHSTDPAITSTPAPSTPSTSSPSAPPLTPDQQQIISQYKAFYEAIPPLIHATKIQMMNELTKYAMPAVADSTSDNILQSASAGKTLGGTIVFNNPVPTVSGDEAAMTECRDASSETVYSESTGAILGHGNPHTLITSKFKRYPSAWLISLLKAERDKC